MIRKNSDVCKHWLSGRNHRVSISTLRRWEREGSLSADFRTNGGHRRYSVQRLRGRNTRTDSI